MNYNFDVLPDRRNTESAKWNYFADDVLPMWVADMDFLSPEPVIRALQERVAHGVFGYPWNLPGLPETILERLERIYSWIISKDDIVVVPGVVTGLNMAGSAFLRAGDAVLCHTPVYHPILDISVHAGSLSQTADLIREPDGSYSIDWDGFEKAITPATRMLVLCNPHNPVGRVFTRAELERIAEVCLRHDLLICSDEIHCDLLFPGHSHTPIASLSPEIAQRTITLMAPSKTYNIAGLGCSFAVIQNPELRKQFQNSHHGLVHGVNLFGLVAARAAYQEGQEWLDQLLVYLDGNRQYLYSFVNEQLPGVHMALPEGTYLGWLDCRETGLGDKPGEFFHKEARVALGEGQGFGSAGKGFVRLNFGCPRSMVVESLERMKKALEAR